MITAEQLAKLYNDKEDVKNQINQAKGRLEVINKQITEKTAELADLGVTPETAPLKIKELEDEIIELYNKATNLVKEIKDVTNIRK